MGFLEGNGGRRKGSNLAEESNGPQLGTAVGFGLSEGDDDDSFGAILLEWLG